MPLNPSRRDTIGPPPRDVSDLAAIVRHHDSYLRSLDPGILQGRFATPKPVTKGPARELVGGDGAGDDTDYAWEFDDRHTATATGTQAARLSHIPIDESLHVFWHPKGYGALRLTSEYFTVDDNIVTIPDPSTLWAVGDTFSFQYEYEVSDEVVDFEFVGVIDGVFHPTINTLTFTPLDAMQPGDFLVATIRGTVAPGGGDVTLGATSGDSRLTSLYSATLPVAETVLTGFATASHADIVTNIVPNPSFSPSAKGVMLVCRGVNSVGSLSATESGSVTPQVSGTAAIAVTWDGNRSFTVLTAHPPDGYTEGLSTGLDYFATDVSYWSDPSAETSVAGSFSGQGCLVIGLI